MAPLRSCRARVLEAFLTSPFLAGIVRVHPQPLDQKIPPQDPVAVYRSYQSDQSPTPNANIIAGPSVQGAGIPSMPQTRVYHYVNPENGNHITSLLPPDHPEMVCLQRGSHVEETKFGFLGEFFLFSLPRASFQGYGADAGLLVRYRRGDCLVPAGDWVVPLGSDRYVQTVRCCDQGTALNSSWWLEQEERALTLSPLSSHPFPCPWVFCPSIFHHSVSITFSPFPGIGSLS